MKFYLQILRTYFGMLSILWPAVAAKQAFNLFASTRKKKLDPNEKHFYNNTLEYLLPHNPENIHVYVEGNPNGKVVFLVHGWESNAGSMAGIGQELIQLGYKVISFDLPAHGRSELKRTNIMECHKVFKKVLDYFAPDAPFSVVSHSFGSAITTYTLSKHRHETDHLVFLTSPNEMSTIFSDFRNLIGLGNRAYFLLLNQVRDILNEDIKNVSVSKMAPKMRYKTFTIIHDRLDRVIPFQNAEIQHNAIPKSTLIPLEKIGHYKMLWNKGVLNNIKSQFEPEEDKLPVYA